MSRSTTVLMSGLFIAGLLIGATITLGIVLYQLGPTLGQNTETGQTTQTASEAGACFGLSGVTTSQVYEVAFGGVTKFQLPSPLRSPNAVTVAPDGSVWFGEEAIPGLAHLYPSNGTLVEYPFPGNYTPTVESGHTCTYKTDIWGMAIWNGTVWAADAAKSRLLGLDPSNGRYTSVSLANGSYPYTLTPEGDALWFTQLYTGQIGTLYSNGTLVEHTPSPPPPSGGVNLTSTLTASPVQIVFANSTLGYFLDVSPIIRGTVIYSFNPERFDPKPVPSMDQTLYSPDGLDLGDGGIWVTEHGASDVAFLNLTSMQWAIYPTSWVGYVTQTLPYFIDANGTTIWFNEHYHNEMGSIDVPTGTLTEYSFSSPPVDNFSDIDNTLTLAVQGQLAWFTEYTTNDVGYVNATYTPGFSLSAPRSTIDARPGTTVSFTVDLKGISPRPLNLSFADTEGTYSKPQNITMTSTVDAFPALNGTEALTVTVTVPDGASGDYTLLVTASNGLTSEGAFVGLHVG